MSQPVMQDRIARFVALIEREDATLDEIAQRVIGGESLLAICAAWDVPYSRVAAWIAATPERAAAYEGAMRLRSDFEAEKALDIADGEGEDVARDKLRVDTRMKLIAKWHRQRYGDTITHAGSKDAPLIIQTIERVIIDPKTPA